MLRFTNSFVFTSHWNKLHFCLFIYLFFNECLWLIKYDSTLTKFQTWRKMESRNKVPKTVVPLGATCGSFHKGFNLVQKKEKRWSLVYPFITTLNEYILHKWVKGVAILNGRWPSSLIRPHLRYEVSVLMHAVLILRSIFKGLAE